MYRTFGKRLFDLTAVILAAPLWLPVASVLAVLIRIKLGAPVLFRQQRPGFRGQIFTIFKFRTMTNARDTRGNLLPDLERITPFGRWLRNTSLDELPEFINVLRGEMSLVGPRPLLIQYIPRYSQEQARRHDVLPGLTGWAQVSGRTALNWEERFRRDVWYVDHLSFILDIKIIFLSFGKIVRAEDIVDPTIGTNQEFMGSPPDKPE